jgi:hypothetical protein
MEVTFAYMRNLLMILIITEPATAKGEAGNVLPATHCHIIRVLLIMSSRFKNIFKEKR